MIPIQIHVDFGEVPQRLAKLVEGNIDFTPLMDEVGEFLLERVEENFAVEGRPTWAPLSPVTVEQRGGDAHPILQRSGKLAASFSRTHDATSATVGSNSEYASTHQFGAKQGAFGQSARGGPIPWGDIPARDMFSITDEDRAALLAIILDYEMRLAAG